MLRLSEIVALTRPSSPCFFNVNDFLGLNKGLIWLNANFIVHPPETFFN
jgi:hypothetical protein